MKSFLKAVRERIEKEPVATMALVQSATVLATEFGADLTGGQQTAVLLFVASALGWWTRQQVTPVSTLPELIEELGRLPEPPE